MRFGNLNKTMVVLALSLLAYAVVPVTAVQAKQPSAKTQSTISPAQAAARAKARHGGKVLKVTPVGRGYRVKLLTNSGRVITVRIKG